MVIEVANAVVLVCNPIRAIKTIRSIEISDFLIAIHRQCFATILEKADAAIQSVRCISPHIFAQNLEAVSVS